MKLRRFAATLAAATVLLAGCGDDRDPAPADAERMPTSSHPSSTTTAPPSTTTSTTTTTTTAPATTAPAPAAAGGAPGIARAPGTAPPATEPPTATEPPPVRSGPVFSASVVPIDDAIRARMTHSWREGCPVPLDQLRFVTVLHWNEAGVAVHGELVVHADVADAIVGAFRRLYEIGFPVARMQLVDVYQGDDRASMRANNTSAFNCRTVSGTSTWSEHAYGRAVDVNPLVNPWVRGGTVDPPEGRPYADRGNRVPGGFYAGDESVQAFAAIGWTWGGTWSNTKDYQHFSESGR